MTYYFVPMTLSALPWALTYYDFIENSPNCSSIRGHGNENDIIARALKGSSCSSDSVVLKTSDVAAALIAQVVSQREWALSLSMRLYPAREYA